MVAFGLLLTALTGENFGTVAAWPVAHHRADGGVAGIAAALVEQVKPRRGPERQHMIRPLEDLPAGSAGLPAADGEEHWLFRSPLRVYLLLLDLTELARRLSGYTSPFTAFNPNPGRFGDYWCEGLAGYRVLRWARRRGFPAARSLIGQNTAADAVAQAGRLPALEVRRLRQTVIENRRRPVAHTRATMNDTYLRRSRAVAEDGRSVVADTLRSEVAKARARQSIPVFTPGVSAARAAAPGAGSG